MGEQERTASEPERRYRFTLSRCEKHEDGELNFRSTHFFSIVTTYSTAKMLCEIMLESPHIEECKFFERDGTSDTCFVDICLDFDGVLHNYTSGWQGAGTIPDGIVEGAIPALYKYLDAGKSIAIYSARSSQPGGIDAMKAFIQYHDKEYRESLLYNHDEEDLLANPLIQHLEFPANKPAAKIYVDDRGVCFTGPDMWDSILYLADNFQPWYKKD